MKGRYPPHHVIRDARLERLLERVEALQAEVKTIAKPRLNTRGVECSQVNTQLFHSEKSRKVNSVDRQAVIPQWIARGRAGGNDANGSCRIFQCCKGIWVHLAG